MMLLMTMLIMVTKGEEDDDNDIDHSIPAVIALVMYCTHILKSPDRIHNGFDPALVVEGKYFVQDLSDTVSSSLLEHQLSQTETADGLVFVVQSDWTDLVHLPPLGIHIIGSRLLL